MKKSLKMLKKARTRLKWCYTCPKNPQQWAKTLTRDMGENRFLRCFADLARNFLSPTVGLALPPCLRTRPSVTQQLEGVVASYLIYFTTTSI